MANDRQELAEDRTEWAHERTLLAKERTYSAWVRTGLAAIAVGVGVTRLLDEAEPQWLITALGAVLVFAGGMALILGFSGYRKTLKKLEREGIQGTPIWVIAAFTLALLIGAGAGLAVILLNGTGLTLIPAN